jgi:hypothetical protein
VVPRGNWTRQLILGGKPSSRSWHTIVCHGRLYFAQTPSNPKTMAQRAQRDWMEKPLPEACVGTRGVFYQGGCCYIYLERGEQPIRCSDTHPNLGSIICRICAKGYLVGLNYNPRRLLREDNGYFKVLLGNWRTVYMLTI